MGKSVQLVAWSKDTSKKSLKAKIGVFVHTTRSSLKMVFSNWLSFLLKLLTALLLLLYPLLQPLSILLLNLLQRYHHLNKVCQSKNNGGNKFSNTNTRKQLLNPSIPTIYLHI